MKGLSDLKVAVTSGTQSYPAHAPYDPPEDYPELPFRHRPLDKENGVYPMVRESLRLLGMDSARFGQPDWNPLGEIMSPGERVLIKPNFVLHYNVGTGPLEAVVTHASVLRAIADYVLIALKRRGELIIGDAPQMNCDLPTLFQGNGMQGLATFLAEACQTLGTKFSVKDFREEQTYYKVGIIWKRRALGRATAQTIPVSLGRESFMEAVNSDLLYGADYDRRQTLQAHQGHRHGYRIASELLSSDVVISVPKLKVHSKVGTTLNLKNMVGINTDKNHLAHYRVGPPSAGGDEFSNPQWYDKLDRRLSDTLLGRSWRWGKYPFVAWRAFRKLWRYVQRPAKGAFTYGNWHGNDTAWRMALDLNRVVLTADQGGKLASQPVRRYFSFIDGIVGGQGDGPLHPDAYRSGVILAGFNPVAVDWVATSLMGFDPSLIPMYSNAVEQMREWVSDFAVDHIQVCSNTSTYRDIVMGNKTVFKFASAPGWRGKIERYMSEAPCESITEVRDVFLQ
jgi:uncharacterized protein (DUF362 family)